MQQKENCLHPGQLLVDTRQKNSTYTDHTWLPRNVWVPAASWNQEQTQDPGTPVGTPGARLMWGRTSCLQTSQPADQFTTQCLWHSQQGRHSCWSAIQKELHEVYLQRSTSQENTEGRGSSASVDQQLISSCLSFLLFSCSWFCWIFSLLTSITFSFIDNMLRPEMIASTGG